MTESGKRIAELREFAGFSQQELADRLFVSRSLVARWENGTRRPDRRCVAAMEKLFGVPAGSLVKNSRDAAAELSGCIPRDTEISPADLALMLDGFLSELCDSDRRIFLRRYHFFDRPAEIAEKIGMKKGSVRMSLCRSRKKLKIYLSEKGGKTK